jgi:hypothetical protein
LATRVEGWNTLHLWERDDSDNHLSKLQFVPWSVNINSRKYFVAQTLKKAAGAADADAVLTDFNDASRKTREFYLRHFSEGNTTLDKMDAPDFIQSIISKQMPDMIFDANTSSQIRMRRQNEKKAAGLAQQAGYPRSPKSTTPGTSTTHAREEAEEAVAKEESLAKRAAGFANGEEAANMAAVLSGMGPVAKQVASV